MRNRARTSWEVKGMKVGQILQLPKGSRVQNSGSHTLVLLQRVTEEGLTRRCLKDSIRINQVL